MNIKRFIGVSVTIFIFVFVYEFLFHGILLQSIYESTKELWRGEEDCIFAALIGGQFLLALALTYIYVKGFRGERVQDGVKFGIFMTMAYTPSYIIMHGVARYPLKLTLSWIVGGAVEFVLIGLLLGLMYRKKEV